jgi:hypothetical protein
MSSKRSMAAIKVKKVLGTQKRSDNPMFDQSWGSHKKLEDFAMRMRSNLKNYRSAMQAAADASELVMKDITDFYADPQVQTNSPGMIPIVHEFKSCQIQSHVGAKKSLQFFDSVLMSPLDSWCKCLEAVRKRVHTLEENHSVFDHYQVKFDQLVKAKAVRQERGKSESEKDIEKYNRNETKLFSARDEFNANTTSLCKELTDFHSQRFEVFNPVIAKLVQFHITRNKLWYVETCATNFVVRSGTRTRPLTSTTTTTSSSSSSSSSTSAPGTTRPKSYGRCFRSPK